MQGRPPATNNNFGKGGQAHQAHFATPTDMEMYVPQAFPQGYYPPASMHYMQQPAPYHNPGMCPQLCPHLSPAWQQIAAYHVSNARGNTRIIDCGASITTVGMHTSLHGMLPATMLLRTTQGCTPRVFKGTCRLSFPDAHGKLAEISLPAITSPDIQPDIVLLSYHQLLQHG
jgi:hypothetical protein